MGTGRGGYQNKDRVGRFQQGFQPVNRGYQQYGYRGTKLCFECGSPEHVKENCPFINYNNGFMGIEVGRGRGRGREPFHGGRERF